jgi:RimJ/RimL family protein N-acetyltransferase
MAKTVPDQTIKTFARTIHQEALKYGFSQIDIVRLINALMDTSADEARSAQPTSDDARNSLNEEQYHVTAFPLASDHLRIRRFNNENDKRLLETWVADEYGKHFLLSCAAAQQHTVDALLATDRNQLGIIELLDGTPIGAVAFLDIDSTQRRAELRKLIGARNQRGKGYAEEATSLWIQYGVRILGLEKIYVSTLQTHLRNIKLNESVGFRVEGILRSEVRLEGKRHDVLRMGLCI